MNSVLSLNVVIVTLLCCEVPLEAPDDCVRFGSVVQLQAVELCVALAALVGARQVDRVQQLVAGCPIVASGLLEPCVRNCFRILRYVRKSLHSRLQLYN